MRLSWTIAGLAAATILGGTTPARAQAEDVTRPVIFTAGAGVSLPSSGRFFGGNVTSPLALGYLGVDVQVDLSTHGGMGAFAALIPALGGVVGGSARLVQPWRSRVARVTAGLGPAYASSGSVLVTGDASLQIRSKAGFAMVLGPALAVAVNRVGDGQCGADTCTVYIPRGAWVALIRLGLGFNL